MKKGENIIFFVGLLNGKISHGMLEIDQRLAFNWK
jgi:hypothetical protein